MDIAEIALLLSLIPLAIMVMRMVFAASADQIGTKGIEVMESFAMIIAIAIYALSRNAQAFAAAQFSEGVREAGFWATVRTDLLHATPRKHITEVFATLVGLRQLADGLGKVSIGFLILFISFQTSFTLLFFLSLMMLVLILTINKNPFKGFPVSSLVLKKIFRRRSSHFWYHSLGVLLQELVPTMLTAFLLPLYLYTVLGLSYFAIGILLGVYAVMIAIANLAAVKLRLNDHILYLAVLMMVPALMLLPYAGELILLPIVMLAIGHGFGNIFTEKIITMEVKRRKQASTEIGAIYFPLMGALFIFMALAGIAIDVMGFAPVFYTCAFIILYYVLYVKALFRSA